MILKYKIDLINIRRTYKLNSTSLFLLMFFILPAAAGDYFNPAFLGLDTDKENIVDLSVFEKADTIIAGEYLATISINGKKLDEYVVQLDKFDTGQLTPMFTLLELKELGVNLSLIPNFKDIVNKKDFNLNQDKTKYSLLASIPSSKSSYNLPKAQLALSIPQIYMYNDYGAVNEKDLDEGVSGLLLNYLFNAGKSRYSNSGTSSTMNNFFFLTRGQLNIGAWRLFSNLTYSYSSNGNIKNSNVDVSSSYIKRAFYHVKSDLLAGELSINSSAIEGFPFKGILLNSNENMYPSSLRGFAPVIEGIAKSNALVSVRQNGNLIYQAYVSPGPFSLKDLTPSNVAGDLQVTIEEESGEKSVFVVPFSSAPDMLRTGRYTYELATGKYNGGTSTDSREEKFFLGTFNYGFNNRLSPFINVILAKNYKSLTLGSGISLGDLGSVSIDVTQAAATLINDIKTKGQSYRIRYSKSINDWGTTFNLTALRYSTRDYYSFSEFNTAGYDVVDSYLPWSNERRKTSLSSSINQSFGDYGSISLFGSQTDYWQRDIKTKNISLAYNNSLRGMNYGINYSLNKNSGRDKTIADRQLVAFSINIPFSVFTANSKFTNDYIDYSYQADDTGQYTNKIGVSGRTKDGDWNYSARQGYGNRNQNYSANLSLGYNASMGNYSANYGYSRNAQNINLQGNGSALLHSGGVTLSSTSSSTLAIIEVDQAKGAKINNSNNQVDRFGYVLAGNLAQYSYNYVDINPSTLPNNVTIDNSSKVIVPTSDAFVKVKFNTKVGYQIILTLTNEINNIPFGSITSFESSSDILTGIVGDGGQVYMSGMPSEGSINVSWGKNTNQKCVANYYIPNVNQETVVYRVNATCSNNLK